MKRNDGKKWIFLAMVGIAIVLPLTAAEIDFQRGYSPFAGTMADMTWPEIEALAKKGAAVLLPLGVIEEHGPHIACGADIYLAYAGCALIQAELDPLGVPAIIAPPFFWGINTSTRNFPGSFDMRPETMRALLSDILANLKHWGFSDVLMVNFHGEGGHNQLILECARRSLELHGIRARYVVSKRMAQRHGLSGAEDFLLTVEYTAPPGGPRIAGPDFHAGAAETGDMAAFFPAIVNTDLAGTLAAPEPQGEGYGAWGKDARRVTPLGYAGDPSKFDAEWSRRAFEKYAAEIARAFADDKKINRISERE